MLEELSGDNDTLSSEMDSLREQLRHEIAELQALENSKSKVQSTDSNSRGESLAQNLVENQSTEFDSNSATKNQEHVHDPENAAMLVELEDEIHHLRESLRVQTKLAANSSISQVLNHFLIIHGKIVLASQICSCKS